ncbi:hypothetical protein crov079 [Cafeteria roenbergensis virus]|uniref:Uncharacterized protein n=1 Tax=Cafeteria roenbergensis virus (strain BV-PW1) TaxID=693272 RepID=E3T4J9_CROVB|nr:hypothetical protein crov079 [Cafeteria roenbergensis virus BV-PW1]ADO67112.1 hypothetical protein crov079 [Cafeteria roenbergensis virus BV-PW1]
MSNEINQKDLINMNNKIIRDQLLWNVSNTENIVRWISTCNLNILLLKTYLNNLKYILRVNTLWSLLISSVTSTISVTQFTISDITNPTLSLAIKIVIFVTSVFTSLITGYIKVEKIQETIEIVEDHKNQWSNLMFYLLSELQVSIDLRNRADHIIKKKREDFNNINSKNIIVPPNIREAVSKILVEKRYLEYTKEKNLCCNFSQCCRINQFHNFNVANTKRKLSLFVNINKILEKEILSLLIYYPDEIKRIIFDNESDMFKFAIHTTDFNVSREKIEDSKLTGKNLYIYTPTERACSIVKQTRLPPTNIINTYSSYPSFTPISSPNTTHTQQPYHSSQYKYISSTKPTYSTPLTQPTQPTHTISPTKHIQLVHPILTSSSYNNINNNNNNNNNINNNNIISTGDKGDKGDDSAGGVDNVDGTSINNVSNNIITNYPELPNSNSLSVSPESQLSSTPPLSPSTPPTISPTLTITSVKSYNLT